MCLHCFPCGLGKLILNVVAAVVVAAVEVVAVVVVLLESPELVAAYTLFLPLLVLLQSVILNA